MDHRLLGRTGVHVSPLCLGCMMFGGKTSEEDSCAIIDRALDAGVNFLDTADVYSRGESERVTGLALKRNGRRDRVVLATKFHGAMADDDPNAAGSSRRHIMRAVEDSLRRLQTDHIDLYQLHRPRSDTPIDETLRAIDDLVRQGKVRYFGTSTFAAFQVVESLWASEVLGLNRTVCEQPPYNLLDRRIERELVPVAQQYGLALIPWSPLAAGLLTGKYTRDRRAPDQRPADTRFAGKDNTWVQRNFTDRCFDVVETLVDMAAAKSCTPSQLALAWVMHQPAITSPIIGPRTMDQLIDNLGALEVTISDEDRKRLDNVSPPGRAIASYYDADWHQSRFRWR